MREMIYDDSDMMGMTGDEEEVSALDDSYHPEDELEEHKDEEPMRMTEKNEGCRNGDNIDMARKMLLERSKKRAQLSDIYQTKQYVENFKIMG